MKRVVLTLLAIAISLVTSSCTFESIPAQMKETSTDVTNGSLKPEDEASLEKIMPIEDLLFFEQEAALLIYFGRPTCVECVSIEPILFEALDETKTPIYYFNTDFWREKDGYSAVLKRFNVDSVPLFVQIEDGELLRSLSGNELLSIGGESEQIAFLKSFLNFAQ